MTNIIIDKIIKNKKKVTIFFADWCGYCQSALSFLKSHKISFKAYNIEKIGIEKLHELLIKSKKITNFDPNHKTIPIIFYDKKFIGGLDNLIEYYTKNIKK